MQGTYVINKLTLKKTLTSLGVSDNTANGFLAALNKMNRHVNAVTFVGLLEKLGLKQQDISNILRRVGVDDVTITEIFSAFDEQKIQNMLGKVVELKVD